MALVKDPGWVVHSYLIIGLESRWVALCISMDMGVSLLADFTLGGWGGRLALGGNPNIRNVTVFSLGLFRFSREEFPDLLPGEGW